MRLFRKRAALSSSDLAALYRRFGPVVRRRALRILGSAAAADDVVQEVFLRLLRYGADLSDPKQTLAWLLRVGNNCAIDYIKRDKRHHRHEYTNQQGVLANRAGLRQAGTRGRPDLVGDTSGQAVPAHDITCPFDDSLELRVAKRQIVMAFLVRLDRKSREIAIMHFVDELSQDAIATRLGVCRKTVTTRLDTIRTRARKFGVLLRSAA